MARVDELSLCAPRDAGRSAGHIPGPQRGRSAPRLWPFCVAVLVAHWVLLSFLLPGRVSALRVVSPGVPAQSGMAMRLLSTNASSLLSSSASVKRVEAPSKAAAAKAPDAAKLSAMAELPQPTVQAMPPFELKAAPELPNALLAGLALLGDSEASDDGRYLPRPMLTLAPVAQGPVDLLWPTDTSLIGSYTGVLKLFIDEQGRVQRVVLDDDALPQALAEAARRTFQSLVFSPAEVDGQRVKSRIRVEVRFDAESLPAGPTGFTGPALPR